MISCGQLLMCSRTLVADIGIQLQPEYYSRITNEFREEFCDRAFVGMD